MGRKNRKTLGVGATVSVQLQFVPPYPLQERHLMSMQQLTSGAAMTTTALMATGAATVSAAVATTATATETTRTTAADGLSKTTSNKQQPTGGTVKVAE